MFPLASSLLAPLSFDPTPSCDLFDGDSAAAAATTALGGFGGFGGGFGFVAGKPLVEDDAMVRGRGGRVAVAEDIVASEEVDAEEAIEVRSQAETKFALRVLLFGRRSEEVSPGGLKREVKR